MGFKANVTNIIHQIVIGSLFILTHIGIVIINPTFSVGLDIWVATNLIAMSFMFLRKSFTTPKAIDVKCPGCHQTMETTSLTCKFCGSGFTMPK